MFTEDVEHFFVIELVWEVFYFAGLFWRFGLFFCHKRIVSNFWCPRRDSNAELLLRTELFYPLNYGDEEGKAQVCACINLSLSDESQICRRQIGAAFLISRVTWKCALNKFIVQLCIC